MNTARPFAILTAALALAIGTPLLVAAAKPPEQTPPSLEEIDSPKPPASQTLGLRF